MSRLGDLFVVVTDRVPEGQIWRFGERGDLFVAPLTAWSMAHEGRRPLHSRYTRGMAELERDRRRRPPVPTPPPCLFCRRDVPCECAGVTCMCSCGRCLEPR